MKKKQVKTLKLVTRIPASLRADSRLVEYSKDAYAVSTRGAKRIFNVSVAAVLLLGTAITFMVSSPVQAAACATPPTDLGTLTLTINAPAAATYTIWSRLMVPDATNTSVNLQVDANDCFDVGGGSITANTWTWVNYANASTATPVRLALTAGNHTLKYIGTKAGVSLDRVIVTSDTACTPTGLGDNCQSGDAIPPTVNLTSPTNNQAVTGSVNMTATASDADSGVASVAFLVDGQVVGTDTSSPYSYAWNSATSSNGTHSLTAKATDVAGNAATSTAVTVTVSGGSGAKQGDLNGDGKVNITDLSILLTNWNKTGVPVNQGDINSSGKVDITDLSILLSRWG